MLSAGLAISCSSSTSPAAGVPESALVFLMPNPGAPSLAGRSVSFYAVSGQDRSGVLYYPPVGGAVDSLEFAEFVVPGGALLTRPDGSAIAPGDSLLITMSVVDPTRLILGFQPTGLRFATGAPATLKIEIAEADSGLTVTEEDALGLWRQEQPGGLWFHQPSAVHTDSLDVDGTADGFSVYAGAYRR